MDWPNVDIDDEMWKNLEPLQDLNPQQETPEPKLLPPHVETNHGQQLNQAAEPSPEPSRRGRRAKLTDPERKEHKRQSDRRYRQKQKNILENWKKKQEDLEKQAGEMRSENNKSEKERLLKYIQHLEKEINELKSQRHALTDMQGLNNVEKRSW